MLLLAKQKQISDLSKQILELHKKFHGVEENSNEWHELKEEIELTDKKIDVEVYKLYSLTEEEIRVVEDKQK
jgi:type II restriction/modification system DNA methylase subunit YeeA